MLNAVWTKCQDYYDDLPQGTLHSVVRSAFFSFVATLIYTPELKPASLAELARPAAAAAVAATASLIYALTTPLFHYIFGDKDVKFEREFIKNIITVTLTGLLFIRFISYQKTHLVGVKFFGPISANLIKSMLDNTPRFMDWSIGPSQEAQAIRAFFNRYGLGVDPEANSAFYSFNFPADV